MTSKPLLPSHDIDPTETEEWLSALDSIIDYSGRDRAQFVVGQVLQHFQNTSHSIQTAEAGDWLRAGNSLDTPYRNSIPSEQEAILPEDQGLAHVLTNAMRWNAIMMVMRVAQQKQNLGGHLASYASIACLLEVGFNHFFYAKRDGQPGDLVFFQGHSIEGIYARAFLEGRLSEQQLIHFRQEAFKDGLSSYPHPHLMPDFWQFPTVSMGLGPLMAIYQAQSLKYLHHRQLANTSARKVWAFCGDGEMGEPESLGALNIAGREKLDNLIFVINCNTQRLDGPVWGNGKIVQEYEAVFRGAGWRVIKVIWGARWDALFAKDTSGLLHATLEAMVDGEYQAYTAKSGDYIRQQLFGRDPQLAQLVADMSDEQLEALIVDVGGHDPQKVYAAYHAAVHHSGQPVVVLVRTIKGYGLGKEGQGLNITHNIESLSEVGLKALRDRWQLNLTDSQVAQLAFYQLPAESAPIRYLRAQREKLGGYLPQRSEQCGVLQIPGLDVFQPLLTGSGERKLSTGMAFARIIMALLKDKQIKDRVVPIIADEARSLGLEGLFKQIGIYAANGQVYEPEDRKQLVYYREEQKGQLLQQGISEAGAMASWVAAATSYANNQLSLIPFFVYYAMFGYQRFGDLVWAAGDSHARGFIIGGLSGRTTLPGEGLQHQDHHNLLMFSMVPNCISYDPTFGYELAVIIHDGLKRMYEKQENVFYYITTMTEQYSHPAMPEGVQEDLLKGMYLFKSYGETQKDQSSCVQLLGSGAILREVIQAAQILHEEYQVASDVWSVTSFNELRRDIEDVNRHNRLHWEDRSPRQSHVARCLSGKRGPVIAASDFMKLMAEQIRPAIDQPYHVLGTDGFGRSDTRANLRDFFEVDAKMIVFTALKALVDERQMDGKILKKAMRSLAIDVNRPNPVTL